MFEETERFVQSGVEWLRLLIESAGALVIGIGILLALAAFLRVFLSRGPRDFNDVRLLLARYLALGLEFQLAADVLSTAVAPTWDRIGKLAAIAVIRTGLNFFLMKEMKEDQAAEAERQPQSKV